MDVEHTPILAERLRNRIDECRGRLIANEQREQFLVKQPGQWSDGAVPQYVWQDKNNVVREYTAFRVGRALGVNVADIVILPGAERKMVAELIGVPEPGIYLVKTSTSYTLADQEVRQKDPREAFTRSLIFSLFIRRWDPHIGNEGPLRDTSEPMMTFDLDQSFHPNAVDMDTYAHLVIRHLFNLVALHEWGVNPNRVLDRVSLGEVGRAVRDIETLDLTPFQAAVTDSLSPSSGREVDRIVASLRARQQTIRQDAEALFSQLLPQHYRYRGSPDDPRGAAFLAIPRFTRKHIDMVLGLPKERPVALAKVIAVAESAVGQGTDSPTPVLIVDADLVEAADDPRMLKLLAALQHSERLRPLVVFWDFSAQPDLAVLVRRILAERTLPVAITLLARYAHLDKVKQTVENYHIRVRPPTVATALMGLGVPEGLAVQLEQDLRTGLTQQERIGANL